MSSNASRYRSSLHPSTRLSGLIGPTSSQLRHCPTFHFLPILSVEVLSIAGLLLVVSLYSSFEKETCLQGLLMKHTTNHFLGYASIYPFWIRSLDC
mmetsp:Transcript_4980/g.6954  ORF Transcript_4980/g.6954 Transcript_4980/m.6954 type:complete len:96 (+) Transcript_4980:683-970(+)